MVWQTFLMVDFSPRQVKVGQIAEGGFRLSIHDALGYARQPCLNRPSTGLQIGRTPGSAASCRRHSRLRSFMLLLWLQSWHPGWQNSPAPREIGHSRSPTSVEGKWRMSAQATPLTTGRCRQQAILGSATVPKPAPLCLATLAGWKAFVRQTRLEPFRSSVAPGRLPGILGATPGWDQADSSHASKATVKDQLGRCSLSQTDFRNPGLQRIGRARIELSPLRRRLLSNVTLPAGSSHCAAARPLAWLQTVSPGSSLTLPQRGGPDLLAGLATPSVDGRLGRWTGV